MVMGDRGRAQMQAPSISLAASEKDWIILVNPT
jgi:hypothetical protein